MAAKRGAISLLLSLTFFTVSAQEEGDYYRYKIERQEEAAVQPIATDTLLFYRAVQSRGDLFDEVMSYNFFHVDYSRRGIYYADRPVVVDGIELRRSDLSVLRRLGLSEYGCSGLARGRYAVGGMAGADEFSSSEGVPLDGGNVGVFFSGKGYIGGGRAALSATLRRGWSMSVYAAGRGGDDLYVRGVYTSAADAGVRLTKQFESGASFAVIALAALSERGMRSGSTQEAFSLTGDNLYNPAWGRQEGRVRSARVRRDAVPFLMASFASSPAGRTRVIVSAGGNWGLRGYGAPGWYDASTPMPDNYRNMPSYFADAAVAEAVGDEWRAGNEKYTQIDWREMYDRNRMSSRGAIYAVDERMERLAHGEAAILLRTELGRNLSVDYGVRGRYDDSRRYKRMRDLLGAAYLEDIDYFLTDDDTYSNMLQNDLRNPGRRVGEGDRFGYDYSLTDRSVGVEAHLEYRSDRWRTDVSLRVAGESIFRRGYYEKELFAGGGSYGPSRRMTFTPYTVKAAVGYAFTARHYVEARFMAAGSAPDADDLFLNAQYNNRTVDAPSLERCVAAEAVYEYVSPSVGLTVSAYAARERDGRRTMRVYDDLSFLYCDVDVSGIGTLRYGVEAAAEVRLTPMLKASLGASAGRFRYDTDPSVTHYSDTDNTVVSSRSTSCMSGYALGGAPQLCASAELTYLDYRGWAVSCGVHAAAGRYVSPSFVRRTERVARQASASEETYADFMRQERFGDAWSVDASVSRWFRAGDGRVVFTLAVRNLLGTRDTVYGGYESSRIRGYMSGDRRVYVPLGNIITYSYPRTFYCVVSWKF